MRTDCRHYESRTYPNGDVVRKCRLDLAPEAPWRCPDACPSFEARRYDAGWQYGTLGDSMGPAEEPTVLGDDVAALLDAAEDIVNAAAPEALAEAEKARRRPAPWRRGPGPGRRRKKRR